MNCKYLKLTKEELIQYIFPFIPKNKRGFTSKFDMTDILKCIIYKLKTGCQWRFIFIDLESVNYPFSWQTVYCYYRKWSRLGVFYMAYLTFLELKKDKLDTEKLNLDGTHTLVKRSAESVNYQHRKKAKTSNSLIMTDGKGIPIAIGAINAGNHNDLYQVVTQFSWMIKQLNFCKISVENSLLNADKGFDSKKLRRACQRRKIIPNIIENKRNRKNKKRGAKRYFNETAYKERFVNERSFAWLDGFKTLLIRFDKLDMSWLNWHYLAFFLILVKV